MTHHKDPLKTILLGFLTIILTGTALLLLPFATKGGSLRFVDALFMSTSAVCVTGLSVVSLTHLSIFGQLVILALIQIGGLGYMSLTSLLLLSLKGSLSFDDKLALKESFSYPTMHDLVGFFKRILLFVFICEVVGAILLTLVFAKRFGAGSIYYGIFHAVSAFNNAGFSLFPTSFVGYKYNVLLNATVITLIVLGGIGFLVIDELILFITGRVKRISLHTRIVISVTLFLIVVPALLMMIIEHNGILENHSILKDMLVSLFQSVTTRTAGFNTIDLNYMHSSTLFLFVILMFIGASPSGTGGGIKTTTAFVVFISIFSYIRGEEEPIVFKRTIPQDVIRRAFVVFSLSFTFVALVSFILNDLEPFPFLSILFEVVSAISTVGLSISKTNLSLSASFDTIGKLIIIMLMFVGRVGLFTFSIALLKKRRTRHYRLPEGRVYL